MATNKYFHIFCTCGDKVVYEGRFQCYSRKSALSLLREKVGRRNLAGLTFTITEFPIDIMKEIIESILRGKPLKRGRHYPSRPRSGYPSGGVANIVSNKRNPNAPRGATNTKRRLGDL